MEAAPENPTLEKITLEFQPNDLLFTDNSINNELTTAPNEESEPLTAIQELESFASNGLLDASMEDTESFRALGMDMLLEERPKSPGHNVNFTAPRIDEGEAVRMQPKNNQGTERKKELISMNATTLEVESSINILSNMPACSELDIQANGLLCGFEDNSAEDGMHLSTVATPTTAAIAVTTAQIRRTEEDTAGQESSLDQLLKEMDSVSYTASTKGKGKAGPNIRSIEATATHLKKFITRIPWTETTVLKAQTSESASLYPHLNLVSLTEEAETLKPLEAVDRNGKRVIFRRKARKVVDGRAVRTSHHFRYRKCNLISCQ